MDYTYEQYCLDLDTITNLHDNFIEEDIKKITAKLSKSFGNISNLVRMVKSNLSSTSLSDITSALKDATVFSFLKAVKFSVKKLGGYINSALSVVDNTLIKVIQKLEAQGVFTKLVKGTTTIDKVLVQYPVLKKMTGPVVAGIILMIWLNMTFSGKFSGDMDLTKLFKSAVGTFSLNEIFASTNGIKMLILLTTGILSAGALSFPWLAATGANLALAILYTGFKNKKNLSPTELKKIKDKIMKKRISEGFANHLNNSKLNINRKIL